jgi:uncharacterized protein (TIGR02680 family)
MNASAETKFPLPLSARWQLLRAGIQNVWEYDDQRFVFHRGRLLLRGQNESGKTKALEVLLPFLLDASLQPQRLDPFGSNARAMRWNLLNDANPDVNMSIGYVWLELGRIEDGVPRYWTLGAGLKARRSANTVEDWYFMTRQRVDEALRPLDENRVPLTKSALADALGDEGQLFERAADYRRAVNDQLFGLTQDQYSALVDALLQLRRPQLSKQLDPAELSNILTTSLPPLDARVVGSLAEGFERLDRHRAEQEEYHATLLGLQSFLRVYKGYVASFLKARAQELTRAESAYHVARATRRQAEEQKTEADSRLQALTTAVGRLEREGVELEECLRTLRASGAYRTIGALEEAERLADKAQQTAASARSALKDVQRRVTRLQQRLKNALTDVQAETTALEREKELALHAAQSAALEVEHRATLAVLERGDAGSAKDALATTLRMRQEALNELQALQRTVAAAASAVEKAMERMSSVDERVQAASSKLAEAEAHERAARERFLEQTRSWAEGCRHLPVDTEALLELTAEEMRGAIEPGYQSARQALEEDIRSASLAHASTARSLEVVQVEREAVAGAKHHPPAAPSWRSLRSPERAGGPLYLMCEVRNGLPEAERAGLEAALEASGLLDAWVLPEGEVLDARTFEAVLRPVPAPGPTLADLLTPASEALVPAEVIQRVLSAVALAAPGEQRDTSAWVSVDGRFGLGPLHGRSGKAEATFLGAAAREQARLRRLVELDAQVAQLEATLAGHARALEKTRSAAAELEAEVRRFPDGKDLMQRQATSRACGDELAAARHSHAGQVKQLKSAEQQLREATAARDAKASERGLRGWVERLQDLEERTHEYDRAAQKVMESEARWKRACALAEEYQSELAESEPEKTRASRDATAHEEEATRAQSHARALREALGSTKDELLSALKQAEQRQKEVRDELKTSRDAQSQADQQTGAMGQALEDAEGHVNRCDGERKAVEARVRETLHMGLFALAGVELDQAENPLEKWSYTEVLLAARKADEATAKVDASESARDKAWNRVSESHQELMRSLRPEIRVLPAQVSGLTLYRATFNARALTLLELVAELEADIATRDRLLGEEERKLFESFLTGEAHEHLRERLRDATALVKRMNGQLQAHPTSSGMQMKLVWEVAEEAPAGAREAVALLFKSGNLLSDADRTALLEFLRERLAEARARTDARTLQEQLLSVLDYRAWHGFQVQCRSGADGWQRLTKKVHAAGSGGQKAVMLHLPLFAAAAAFYDSARKDAPRLILLDEAFAGIDRPTRGQLMGLLAEFDLDFVMTSFEEWGFYPQLDGLSTYHLAREKGMPGVYADWFIWNGLEAVQVHVP